MVCLVDRGFNAEQRKELSQLEIVTTDAPAQPTPINQPKPKGGFRPGSGRKPSAKPKPPKGEQFVLPAIPFRRGSSRFEDMVLWWLPMTTEQLNLISIYAYRSWPVCDIKILDPDADVNIEKLTGPCPFTADNWRNDLLGRYGSGSYTFFIKEGNVQRWTIYANDIIDLNNYPPLIDYRTLMTSAPANKDFVKWARQRNLIKDYEGDNEGMASQTMDRVLDQVDRLTERVLDQQQSRTATPDMDARAQTESMKLIGEASRTAMDMVKEVSSQMSQATNRAGDPLEQIRAVAELAKSFRGEPTEDGSKALFQQMLEQERARSAELREEMRELRREMRAKPEEDGGLLGQLGKFKDAKDMLVELGIIKGKEDSAAESDAATSASKPGTMTAMVVEGLMRQLPAIIGQGGIQGLIVSAGNTFAQLRALQASPQLQQQPAGGVNPGQPQSQPVLQQPVVQQNPLPPDPMEQFRQYVAGMAPAILHHMNNLDGYAFAQWMINGAGDGKQNYDILKEAETGEAGKVKQLLQLHQPLWDVISKTPAKLDKFIAEFIRFEEWEKEQEELDDDEEDGADGVTAMTAAKAAKA